MKTSLAVAFFFLLVFFVMILVAVNCEPKPAGAQAIGLALEWTLHLLGGRAQNVASLTHGPPARLGRRGPAPSSNRICERRAGVVREIVQW